MQQAHTIIMEVSGEIHEHTHTHTKSHYFSFLFIEKEKKKAIPGFSVIKLELTAI